MVNNFTLPTFEEVKRSLSGLDPREKERRALLAESAFQDKQLGKMESDPWFWARTLTKTYDQHWREKGLQTPYTPFPDEPYFPHLFRAFRESKRLFVPKSRDMTVSWAVMAYGVWSCQVFPRTHVLVQTQTEPKAWDLVGQDPTGYARNLYQQQEPWLQARFPLLGDSKLARSSWRNGSIIQGVPSGADQVRLYHPTIFIVDEAAFVENFKGSYEAADPECVQIIALSSAAPGWFMDTMMTVLDRGATVEE